MQLPEFFTTTGMTQAEFAKRLGVTQGRVSQWNCGRGRPALLRFPKIERITAGKVTHRDYYPEIQRVRKLGRKRKSKTNQ